MISPSIGRETAFRPKFHQPPRIPDHELLRRIGGGSYGDVWLARNVLGGYRAVKVVYRTEFQDERPFEREFAGIQRFEPISRLHETQVDILHVGRNQDCFYYVMELADDQLTGQEIDPERYVPRTVRSEIQSRGKLPLDECVELALALTAALEHLHSHDLVHRDIKPSNIIFIGGTPKLADIGLVTGIDATRSYVGTEGYIPPEGPGTSQADFYGLGKVLYELSSGKDRQDFPEPPTFNDDSAAERSWLEFHEILLKACETDPRQRYQSAVALRNDLEVLRAGKSVRRLRNLERRLALLTRFGLAAAVLLMLAAAGYLFSIRQTQAAKLMAQRADLEAARARRAEGEARESLWESYLAQAQARRLSGRAGRRFESLAALQKAAEIRPSIELRNEAIASLALADLGTIKEWDGWPPDTRMVAFDPSLLRYARADSAGNISLRTVHDDHELTRLPGSGVSAESTLLFSPDGQLLAVTYGADTLQLAVWDLGRKEIIFNPRGLRCRTCDFSPDQRTLAVAEYGGSIHLFELSSGKLIRSLPQKFLPYRILFHPHGAQLAISCTQIPEVEVRDLESGSVVHSFRHPASVLDLAWNREGTLLAAGCADWNIYVWELATQKLRCRLTGHQNAVPCVSFNQKGDLLASIGWDGQLKLWDALNGRPLVSKAVEGGVSRFSRDDRRLCYQRDQPKLGVCEVASARECRRLFSLGQTEGSGMCSYSPDGQLLVSAHRDGIRVWDLATESQVAFLREADAAAARFDPTGKTLFTSSQGGMKQWPVQRRASDGAVLIGSPSSVDQTDAVEKFSLTDDGQTLAFIQEGELWLLDVATRQKRMQLQGPVEFCFSALNSDGRFAAASDWECTVTRVWNARTGEMLRDLPEKASYLAFSPDNEWLVTGTAAVYRFWNSRTWECVQTVRREGSGSIHGRIAFAPGGKMAAIGYSARTVRLIGLPSGAELATFEMPEPQTIYCVCFSPDGSQLAVSGPMPTIYLWNLPLIRRELAAMKLDWE